MVYVNERHRITATTVENWLSADGIWYDAGDSAEPTEFRITASRGTVVVTAVEELILIRLRWPLVVETPVTTDDLRWALRANEKLVVGRILLDDEGIWLGDLIQTPTTQDEFRHRTTRCATEVVRLRSELASDARRPGQSREATDLADEDRVLVTDWARSFSRRRPADGRFDRAIVVDIGPIPVRTAAARALAERSFQDRLDWAAARRERTVKMNRSASAEILSRIAFWQAVLDWFRSTDHDPIGDLAESDQAAGAAPPPPDPAAAPAPPDPVGAADTGQAAEDADPVLNDAMDMSTGEGLSQEQRGLVEQWAVTFNSARPPDGCLTTDVIESAGPIPVSGAPARAVAREYFESKLPAAEVRRKYALQAADPASVPEDFFNAPAYWRAVIAWLDGQGEGTPPLPVPARPQWYSRDDVVELDRDVAIDGRLYPEGTTGTVLDVADDTLVELAREGRIAVMFPGNDLEVVPVKLLRPAGSQGRGPLRSPESCNHAWSQAGYRWGPVDRERRLRPFWSRSVCSGCGAERLHDRDEYSGGDMAIVHLKWRGSTW